MTAAGLRRCHMRFLLLQNLNDPLFAEVALLEICPTLSRRSRPQIDQFRASSSQLLAVRKMSAGAKSASPIVGSVHHSVPATRVQGYPLGTGQHLIFVYVGPTPAWFNEN